MVEGGRGGGGRDGGGREGWWREVGVVEVDRGGRGR